MANNDNTPNKYYSMIYSSRLPGEHFAITRNFHPSDWETEANSDPGCAVDRPYTVLHWTEMPEHLATKAKSFMADWAKR